MNILIIVGISEISLLINYGYVVYKSLYRNVIHIEHRTIAVVYF